jgi:hypothetical protein
MPTKIMIGCLIINLGFLIFMMRRIKEQPDLPCHDQGDCLSCTNTEACAEL